MRRILTYSEIETKFVVDASCKPQVLAGLGDGAEPPVTYEAIYFDTDNLDLGRHQVELRLQHSNDQIVQRIKARAHNGMAGPQVLYL
jgi:inorganic triphosphatase YgiF